MARVSSKSLFFSSSILESPLRTEGGTMPLYLSHPESFSCSHAPTRTETTSICVSIQGRSLQNCFTDRIFRKVKESRYLVNQWCNIDISTQTYICGFPSMGGGGVQLTNSNSPLSSEHYGLWHWTVLSVHPKGWNWIEHEDKFLFTDVAWLLHPQPCPKPCVASWCS